MGLIKKLSPSQEMITLKLVNLSNLRMLCQLMLCLADGLYRELVRMPAGYLVSMIPISHHMTIPLSIVFLFLLCQHLRTLNKKSLIPKIFETGTLKLI
jgi:hypothetical protein